MLEILATKDVTSNLFLSLTHQKVLQVLQKADYLSPKYHVVVANPPYMGGKGMNGRLAKWVKNHYPDIKSDLFSAFVVRNTELALPKGQLGFMTPFVWMFISSYEKLRSFIINKKTITSLIQLEYSGFDGATVPICTFTIENSHNPNLKGGYVRLSGFRGSKNQAPKTLEAIQNPDCGWFYRAKSDDFKKIPGSPIAYWVSDKVRSSFQQNTSIDQTFNVKAGMCTGKNETFILFWYEIDFLFIKLSENQDYKYTPHNKGGGFRRWVGNWNTVLKYSEKHLKEMENNDGFRHDGKEYYFQPHIGWSKITSFLSSFRMFPKGFTFDSAGLALFPRTDNIDCNVTLGFLNSKVNTFMLGLLNPTLNVTPQIIKKLPSIQPENKNFEYIDIICDISKTDWNTYETSWDFQSNPLIVGWVSDSVTQQQATKNAGLRDKAANPAYNTLADIYANWRKNSRASIAEMQALEEENNRLFIEAYGLQDELTPDVPLHEITLTCNPHYRYAKDKTTDKLETLLLADTLKELISYAVSCMFGRYALDKPGLILANQGETSTDYLQQIPEPTFPADKDNVIPLLDGDWFTDDISERFFQFLKVTFGDEHYQENLEFIEQAIGKDIRKYFLKDFYNDHLKRYKKRPIYWLFSSPKGSFNTLIYMHRYRPDTVSVILNDYLREFRTKLSARVDHLQSVEASADASKTEKTKALKEITKLNKMLVEMEEYEREVLYPLATKQIEIDLDDGVKVNYAKFGSALKKVTGL